MNYFKLYITYAKRSIISRLEYKRDTILSIFNFLISNITSILSIYFIMRAIPSLNNWSMMELGFLYGFSMMSVGIDHVFTDCLWNVAYHMVRNGDIDRMFLKPVPVLFQVIGEVFQIEGFGELIVGIVMLLVCGINLNITFSFHIIFMLITVSIFGAIIISSLKIIFASLAFKMKSSGPLLQAVYNFISYAKYPRGIYPKFLRIILTIILPFMAFINIPVEIALGKISFSPYLISLIIVFSAIAFLIVSILIWSFFEKRYESTGS